jgi:hypothetical protein
VYVPGITGPPWSKLRFNGAVLLATDGAQLTTSTGSGALAELGVSIGPEPRTLVIADRDTLSRLVELARSTDPASPSSASAAVVGWWSQRADHPGTGAVLNVTVACSARWVLGVPPDGERQVSVWRTWLGIADAGPCGLLELAALVSAGETLPGLETFTEDDQHSWEAFATRLADPKTSWDWRMRDNRREAALGLATRCDAAELYESLRLGDPLVAIRESFSGTVLSGVVTAVSARTRIEVTLDHLACRLRENAAVEAFPGYPREVPPADGRDPDCIDVVQPCSLATGGFRMPSPQPSDLVQSSSSPQRRRTTSRSSSLKSPASYAHDQSGWSDRSNGRPARQSCFNQPIHFQPARWLPGDACAVGSVAATRPSRNSRPGPSRLEPRIDWASERPRRGRPPRGLTDQQQAGGSDAA